MKKSGFLSISVMLFALTACTGPVIMGTDAAAIYVTKPATPPPADTADQIPEHESWCYHTMGDTECYAHPQDVPPARLVNVDPQSEYPVDLPSYEKKLHPPAPPAAVVVETTVVEPSLQPVIVSPPVVLKQTPLPPPPKAKTAPPKKKKPKKHHKKKPVTQQQQPAIAVPPVVAPAAQ